MEVERIPNGSQTITHPAEEGVVSNLKHFSLLLSAGWHLISRSYSASASMTRICTHRCAVPGITAAGYLPQGTVHSPDVLLRTLPASTHLPGNTLLPSLGETSPSGFHLHFRDLLPGVRGLCTAEPPPCLRWLRHNQGTALGIMAPLPCYAGQVHPGL